MHRFFLEVETIEARFSLFEGTTVAMLNRQRLGQLRPIQNAKSCHRMDGLASREMQNLPTR